MGLEKTVEFSFRSKQGGTVFTIQNEASVHVRFLRLDIENRGVVIRWIAKCGLVVNESLYELPEALDGSWHSVSLNLPGNFRQFLVERIGSAGRANYIGWKRNGNVHGPLVGGDPSAGGRHPLIPTHYHRPFG